MSIYDLQFSTGNVCDATGVSNATLQNWLKRPNITGHNPDAPIKGGGSPGSKRMFSFYNLMEIAVAKALLDAGMCDLKSVFHAAATFAHTGEGPIPNHHPQRSPSLPFDNTDQAGETFIAVRGTHVELIFWQPGVDQLGHLSALFGRGNGFVLINANDVFDKVVSALGFHPETIKKQAYSN